jgi:hypothetical protein
LEGAMKRLGWLFVSLFFINFFLFSNVIDETAVIGSRKNPVPLEELVLVTSVDEKGLATAIIEIGVTGVFRGNYADFYLMASGIDRLPDIGKENIILVVSTEYVDDLTKNDNPVYVGERVFDIANSRYVRRHLNTICSLDGELNGYLYPGSTHVGFLVYEVDKGEDLFFIYQNTWFYIGSKTTDNVKQIFTSFFDET